MKTPRTPHSKCLRRVAGILLLLHILPFVPQAVEAVVVHVIPSSPMAGDYVLLRIEGSRPDACWEFTSIQCGAVDQYQVEVNVYWTDLWVPEAPGCAQVAVGFEEHCLVGILEVGDYTITVNEFGDSLRDPTTYVQTFHFSVDSAISSRSVSWGKIKGIHKK